MRLLKIAVIMSFVLNVAIVVAQDKDIKITSDHIKLYTLITGKVPEFMELGAQQVQFPVWEDGLIVNPEYVRLIKERDANKQYYEEFIIWRDYVRDKKEARALMVSKLQEFLNKKGGYKDKVYLLIEANELSNKYGFLEEFDTSNLGNKTFIYNEKKRADATFLEAFLNYQEELKNTRRGPGYNYKNKEEKDFPEHIRNKYTKLEENLRQTPEYIPGKVLSDKTAAREFLVIKKDKVELTDVIGSFNGESYQKFLVVKVNKGDHKVTVLAIEDQARKLKAEYQDNCEINYTQLFHVLTGESEDKIFATTDLDLISYLKDVNSFEFNPFVFVKTTIDRLNYFVKVRNTDVFATALNKKKLTGMYELPNLDSEINYDNLKYIPFSMLDLKEQFVIRTPFNRNSDMDLFMIIQNLKSKKYFVVNNYLFNIFQDFDHMGEEENGYGHIFKPVPKELTPEEKDRYTRLKSFLNQGIEKSNQIENVLKKYSLRNRYDVSRISIADKKTFNRLLKEMKELYKKADDILNYEDENKVLVRKLTLKELAKLEELRSNYYGVYELNL